jgi:phage terminase large subunit-like protein
MISTLAPRARHRMQPTPPADPVTQYALDVMAGRIVAGVLIRKACERHLRDLATGAERGLRFDVAAALRAIAFPELLKHYKGEWAGQPIALEGWEKFVLGALFGWKRADGTRRFRSLYLEVAKKNGKTILAAIIAILLAFFDGEAGAEVYSIATKRDQAKLSWNDAKHLIAKNPWLNAKLHTFALSIADEASASFFRPLGRDSGDAEQGINAHGAIIDELHVIDDSDSIDNVETAMSARRQPLIVKITTAGKKRQSVWSDERSDAVAVVEGRATDDSMLVMVYTLDEGDDPFDEAVWPKANPNLGVSVSVDFLREQAAKAKRSPGKLAGYLQLRMNVPTQQSTKALDIDEWDKCSGRPDGEEYDDWIARVIPAGSVGYGGLDLASVRDLTALIIPFRDSDGFVDVLCRFWCPEDGIAERSRIDGVPYADWARDGWLIATPGNVTDYTYVRRELTGRYLDGDRLAQDPECLANRYEIAELGYDRWNATQLATEFTEDGATCIQIPQTYAGLGPGWRELERLILDGRLRHGGHPVLRWMAGNVEVETDGAGNQKPSKAKSSERIDGIVGLTMGIARLITHIAEGPSVYDERAAVLM